MVGMSTSVQGLPFNPELVAIEGLTRKITPIAGKRGQCPIDKRKEAAWSRQGELPPSDRQGVCILLGEDLASCSTVMLAKE